MDGFWIKNNENQRKSLEERDKPGLSGRTFQARHTFLHQDKWASKQARNSKLKLLKNSIFSKSGCPKTTWTPICNRLSAETELRINDLLKKILTYSRRMKWTSYTVENQFCDLNTLWEKFQSNIDEYDRCHLFANQLLKRGKTINLTTFSFNLIDAILLTVISDCYICKALEHSMLSLKKRNKNYCGTFKNELETVYLLL